MLMQATNESENFIFRFSLVNWPKSNFLFPADLFEENLLRFIGSVNKKKKKVKWPPVVSAAIYRSFSNLASDSICRKACWMEWIANLKMKWTFRKHFQVPGSSCNKWEQIKFTSLGKKIEGFYFNGGLHWTCLLAIGSIDHFEVVSL